MVGYARFKNDLYMNSVSYSRSFLVSRSNSSSPPCCGALLRALAEEETEFLETRGECVLGGHGELTLQLRNGSNSAGRIAVDRR